jgi:hypothetical protein
MADSEISNLTELTTPALEDLIVVVDDVSTSPVNKKVALSNLVKLSDAWTPYTPEYTSTSGTLTTITTGMARYKEIFTGIYLMEYDVTVTDAGTGDGALIISHPIADINNIRGFGSEAASTGKGIMVSGSTTGVLSIRFYDYTTILVSGYRVRLFAIATKA